MSLVPNYVFLMNKEYDTVPVFAKICNSLRLHGAHITLLLYSVGGTQEESFQAVLKSVQQYLGNTNIVWIPGEEAPANFQFNLRKLEAVEDLKSYMALREVQVHADKSKMLITGNRHFTSENVLSLNLKEISSFHSVLTRHIMSFHDYYLTTSNDE